MEAARLLEKGYSQSEVAHRVGVHQQVCPILCPVAVWMQLVRLHARSEKPA